MSAAARRLSCTLVLAALSGPCLLAQPVVAPTPQAAGSPRGNNAGGYNITNSFELGYRFRSVEGNLGKYRSDVNFGNGLRLLGGMLAVHSREGQGGFFDELLLDVRGLGNDPYQFSSFRLQKNALYRYDLAWRSNEYFNPALTISNGNHLLNTNRQMQDHDLILFPQAAFRLHAGFSRNRQTGAGLATGQYFDSRGDEFPFFSNIRRQQDEYRAGVDFTVRSIKFSLFRGWEFFKDDTRFSRDTLSAGDNPNDNLTLAGLRRDEPYHGSTPYWRAQLTTNPDVPWVLQGRFTHSDGRRGFVFDEAARGTDRFGAERNRQVLLFGSARRPVTTGSLLLSWRPAPIWTVTNSTSFHQARMEGNAAYSEVNNAVPGFALAPFQLLGLRTITNSSELSVQPLRWAGFFGGYQYSSRRIRSRESDDPAGAPAPLLEQTNRQHSGAAGVRLQPVKPLRLLFSAEAGRNDRPFYPTSDRDYNGLSARAQYRTAKASLSAQFRRFVNNNSSSLFLHSSQGRNFSANGSWSPRASLQLEGGYSYLHQDALTGIAYFANFSLVEGDRSFYLTNLHSFHAGAQIQWRRRADFYGGFVSTTDRADGRQSLASSSRPGVISSPAGAFLAPVQVFPLTYFSPLARVSIVVRRDLRWNAGWQYYDYREKFVFPQNYTAHVGFVSLSYSF
jgi:hypothetical protein